MTAFSMTSLTLKLTSSLRSVVQVMMGLLQFLVTRNSRMLLAKNYEKLSHFFRTPCIWHEAEDERKAATVEAYIAAACRAEA